MILKSQGTAAKYIQLLTNKTLNRLTLDSLDSWCLQLRVPANLLVRETERDKSHNGQSTKFSVFLHSSQSIYSHLFFHYQGIYRSASHFSNEPDM